jgi:hypothetical protein
MHVVLIVIKQRIFYMNKGGLPCGDIVVWIGADDQEVSYEARGLALGL